MENASFFLFFVFLPLVFIVSAIITILFDNNKK